MHITVLTWNDWENTIVCLESIFQNTYQNFDIVLVNNGSEKHHIQKIKDWASNKIVVKIMKLSLIKINKFKLLRLPIILKLKTNVRETFI